ncbi:MAG: hypothetical protein JW395_1341 [Nitrospira sp.]|nr:hypothetical protein [Nitrospira sp.]
MELLDAGQQPAFLLKPGSVAPSELQLRDLHHQLFTLRQKFVQRRIEQTNGDRVARHLAIESDEILFLQRQELIEKLFPLFFRPRQDHLLHDRNTILGKEHMFRPTEADPFRTETTRDLRLIRHIRIGADTKRPHFVGP